MGLEIPIPVSMKLGDTNNLFRRIVEAAQRPHLSIPETELGKSTKQHRHLIQRSVGYAVGVFPSPVLNFGIDLTICRMFSSVVRETTVQCHETLNTIPIETSANSSPCFVLPSLLIFMLRLALLTQIRGMAVGATIIVGGIALYRFYHMRKLHSSS